MSTRGGAFVLCVAWALIASAAHAGDVPALQARVNDYAKLLPVERAQTLEARLADYEQRSGHQLALLTLPSLHGDAIEDYSIRVAERWKLGHKGKDDGLILIVVPSEHKMRIEVGYGLEGVIPDAVASRVIREIMAPAFKRNDYAGGIEAAFAVLMHTAGGGADEAAKNHAREPEDIPWAAFPALLPFFLFIVIAILSRMFGGRRRGFFGMPMLPGGGFGGGGFGGGGGGFGGGGFSGGGGGFGGGGASGSW